MSVNHTGTSVSTSIAFNLAEGVPLSKAVAAIDATTNRIGMPTSIRGAYYGTAKTFQASLNNEPWLLLAALVAVYIVLGILYESYFHPLTIISTLPSAGVGALLALLATNVEFSLIAFIGILLLVGIVKKNAIMMIDFAITAQRDEKMDARAAITRACLLRFRPIMMTTCAAIAGALPLALATGDGTEMRRPLGISIVGGLLVSQILTLYTTPSCSFMSRGCGCGGHPAARNWWRPPHHDSCFCCIRRGGCVPWPDRLRRWPGLRATGYAGTRPSTRNGVTGSLQNRRTPHRAARGGRSTTTPGSMSLSRS